MKQLRLTRDGHRNVIGIRLRKARTAMRPTVTQDDLAGRLTVRGLPIDRVAITKIESGKRCVFDFELPALARVLQVDVRWLLGMQQTGGPAKAGEDHEL